MAVRSFSSREKISGEPVLQFSIFLENKVGALQDVVRLLNEHDIHVIALSVHDSADSSIVRIIVSDPDRVAMLFEEHDFSFSKSELVVVELVEGGGQLGPVLTSLLVAEVNIHFSYPLLTRPRDNAALAFHVDDVECARSVLESSGYTVLNQNDLSR